MKGGVVHVVYCIFHKQFPRAWQGLKNGYNFGLWPLEIAYQSSRQLRSSASATLRKEASDKTCPVYLSLQGIKHYSYLSLRG